MRRAPARRLRAWLIAALVFLSSWSGASWSGAFWPAMARPLAVTATPLRLHGWAEGAPLTPVAAFRLGSSEEHFGGLSGMLLEPDRAWLVSDRGHWAALSLTRNEQGHITGISGGEIGPLLEADGRALKGGRADAESLARTPDGTVWIGFERADRVAGLPALGRPIDQEASQLPRLGIGFNKGVEALAVDPDGALIAIAEEPLEGERALSGWRMIGGRAEPFHITRSDGFSATGADFGPDGALWLLERDYSLLFGPRMRNRRFPAPVFTGVGGAAAELGLGETLITLGRGAPIDNMEAIAVERAAYGGMLATVASDDNFNFLQSTVVLQFSLRR